jgi:hypothetical protein
MSPASHSPGIFGAFAGEIAGKLGGRWIWIQGSSSSASLACAGDDPNANLEDSERLLCEDMHASPEL